MKRNTVLGTTVFLALACCAQAQTDEGPKCTNETLKGSYGIQFTGIRPVQGGFVGQLERVEGASVRVYDGKGKFTQAESSKGTTIGVILDRPGNGTYVVTADCSVTTTIQIAPGITAVTRGVVVDGGKEIRGFTVSPVEANISFVARLMK